MNYNLLFLIFVIGLLAVGLFVIQKENKEIKEVKLYQGPVPFGYDEKHFRETGETVKIKLND